MISASSISAAIRAKKKKLEEAHDPIDVMQDQHDETGDRLSENHPKERDESPSLDSLISKDKEAQPHDEMAPDPKEVDEKKARHMKMRSMLSRMGK